MGADALPEIVQIGNEIRSGLLFPDGELPDYGGMVKLVNAGIRGARAVADPDKMKIMIHLDQGGRYFYLKEWFDRAIAHGLEDFDIIGLSYYAFWHGTFTDLKESMEKLAQDYGKPIIVAEMAHAWRKSKNGFIDDAQERIAGVPATPQGQKKVLDLVMNITASIPDNMGIGVYYWEPICVPKPGDGGWSENMGILDETGKAHESIKSFMFTREGQRFNEVAKVYEPRPMTLLRGMKPLLPEQLNVLYYDGRIRKHDVQWIGCTHEGEQGDEQGYGQGCEQGYGQGHRVFKDMGWVDRPGEYLLSGKIQDTELRASMKVKVVEQLEESVNLIRDENWEDGFAQWMIEKSDDRVMALLCPEQEEPFPAPPVNYIRVESPMNFRFAIYQEIMIQDPGMYKLQVEYRGTDTTDVNVRMFIGNREDGCFMEENHTVKGNSAMEGNRTMEENGAQDREIEQIIHPTDDDWVLYEINGFECRPGAVKAGIRIFAPPIFGKIRRFKLLRVRQ
jgi:arabinogalactan endo-1,4-beta-galactosidase